MEVYSFSLEISDLRVIMFSVIHLIVFVFFIFRLGQPVDMWSSYSTVSFLLILCIRKWLVDQIVPFHFFFFGLAIVQLTILGVPLTI